MEQSSSSSKVTVEYFDPFSVYQLLSPGLLPRLPLRNLHWDSHAGPLRSIQSLHIDLIPSGDTPPLSSPSNPELSRVKSSESVSSVDDGFRTQTLGKSSGEKDRPPSRSGPQKGKVKGRRHQIPGLRQTPYLKIFFLRCDDVETYKTQSRKQVREWLKENTPPAQSTQNVNAQENHDAFEWLIVHVIVPNTAAATQARTSAKGSSTILEKLKADFNGSSRSAVDRVAQIRIGINDVPYDILPRVVPAIPGSYSETPKEHEESWADLIAKFKSLILSSFDMRVSQYEDDIKEKDAQRSLPGWNFCTFFVLKEGLARGFESVGLVEDALVGYDELAVGLDTILQDQSNSDVGSVQGSTFLPYTEDLRQQFEKKKEQLLKDKGISGDEASGPIDLQSAEGTHAADQDEIAVFASRKSYRDLILSSNISVFDFRCYLFARQLSLLLRLANASSSREELLAKLKEQRESSLLGLAARQPPPQPSEDVENLSVLGEVCRRALQFIASIAHIMRDDLLASDGHRLERKGDEANNESFETERDTYTLEIIDNMVSSYTFSIAQQILAQTSTRSLPIPPSILAPGSTLDLEHEQKVAIPEPKTMMHPARTTSLLVNPRATGNGPPSPNIFSNRRSSIPDPGSQSTSQFLKPGLEELAAHRAELYLLSRNVLERLGEDRNWPVGWEVLSKNHLGLGSMQDIDIDDSPHTSPHSVNRVQAPTLHGIDNNLLRTALDNEGDFYRLYETLTDKSLRHYTVAGHIKSVQSKMTDLAMLKFHFGDYPAAALYFYRLTPFYGDGGWEDIEMCMLVIYLKCLKNLKRSGEYVRVGLKLLAKGAAAKKENSRYKSSLSLGQKTFVDKIEVSVDGYLTDVLSVMPTLQNDVSVPLQNFFSTAEVVGGAQYHKARDSFTIEVKLRYLLADEIKIDKATARLVPISGGQGRDIWLEAEEAVIFKEGVVRIKVECNVIIPGTYVVKELVLYSGKMVLSYDETTPQPLNNGGLKFFKCPHILLYQRPEAFDIKLTASRYLHLDRNRSLEIILCSGWNNVLSGELHVRAATAGLRLQTSEVKLVDGRVEIMKKSDAGVIRFGAIGLSSRVKISVPFNLEHEVSAIQLKVEISYTTDDGSFFFASNPSMSIVLPLGVNVQDVFKHKALFSKFTISSATSSPLRLLSSALSDSDVFEASSGAELINPIIVFPRQPASLLYKITPRPKRLAPSGNRKKEKSSLSLTVHYICLEEEVDTAVTQALVDALKDSQFYEYGRLIVLTVLSQLHSRVSPYDYERTAMVGELSTAMLSGVKWRDHFTGLGFEFGHEDTAKLLADWLEKWQTQRPRISLLPITTAEEAISESRSITIPVEVPAVTVVHTADFKLSSTSQRTGELVAVMHKPIPATLHLKWTRIWDSQVGPNQDRTLDFVFEITASSDSWIVGGQRKGYFKVPPSNDPESGKTLKFPVVLIAMKEGYLPYPNIEIKPVINPKPPQESGSGKMEESEKTNDSSLPITCETDYKNVGEVIRVIANARTTTLSLDASGPQGGAWLLESNRRGNDQDVFVG